MTRSTENFQKKDAMKIFLKDQFYGKGAENGPGEYFRSLI